MLKPILIRDRILAAKLRDNLVSEGEKMFYFIFFIIILPVLGTLEDSFFQSTYNNVGMISSSSFFTITLTLIPYIISLYSLIFSYRLYVENNKTFFVDKLICILFPIFIRIFLLKLIVGIMINFFFGILDGAKITEGLLASSLSLHITNIIGSIYLFFRLRSNTLLMIKT